MLQAAESQNFKSKLTGLLSKTLLADVSTWMFEKAGQSQEGVPNELRLFHKSWLLFVSKHTSDVYPICLKLSRQAQDIIGGNGNGVATVEDTWFLKELNNELPQDSADPLLGIFTRESNTGVHIRYD